MSSYSCLKHLFTHFLNRQNSVNSSVHSYSSWDDQHQDCSIHTWWFMQQGNSTHQISTRKPLTQQPLLWASMSQRDRNGPSVHISTSTVKPTSQAGDVHAKGVKSPFKLIPPWGCRQVCSSPSACAAAAGIAVSGPCWEGRHLLPLPAFYPALTAAVLCPKPWGHFASLLSSGLC